MQPPLIQQQVEPLGTNTRWDPCGFVSWYSGIIILTAFKAGVKDEMTTIWTARITRRNHTEFVHISNDRFFDAFAVTPWNHKCSFLLMLKTLVSDPVEKALVLLYGVCRVTRSANHTMSPHCTKIVIEHLSFSPSDICDRIRCLWFFVAHFQSSPDLPDMSSVFRIHWTRYGKGVIIYPD